MSPSSVVAPPESTAPAVKHLIALSASSASSAVSRRRSSITCVIIEAKLNLGLGPSAGVAGARLGCGPPAAGFAGARLGCGASAAGVSGVWLGCGPPAAGVAGAQLACGPPNIAFCLAGAPGHHIDHHSPRPPRHAGINRHRGSNQSVASRIKMKTQLATPPHCTITITHRPQTGYPIRAQSDHQRFLCACSAHVGV